jgi:hypothetical protein
LRYRHAARAAIAKPPRLRKAACPSGDPQRQSCGFSSVEAIMQAVERKASRRHMTARMLPLPAQRMNYPLDRKANDP